MWKILPVLGVVPLITGAAMAAQPLTNQQMDGVTAGFTAYNGPDPATQQALAALVASVGPPPPLVSRDNFPPSAFTQPTEQNPFQVYRLPSSPSGTIAYTCGICFIP